MIDPLADHLIALRDLPALLPRRNVRKIHISTIYRWTLRGIAGVRLEIVTIGGTSYTSREALGRFVVATTQARRPGMAPPPTTTRQAEQARRRAARICDEAGIGIEPYRTHRGRRAVAG